MTAVDDAVEAARAGRLIVLPTDTVYGIGSRPDRAVATAAIFAAKRRSRELELPILAPTIEAAQAIARLDERAVALARRFWPGALTLVLERTSTSAAWDLGGNTATVGVRVPRHPLALEILQRTGPLAVTSANRSGRPPAATCEELVDAFGDAVEVYLCEDAPLEGTASTVLDLSRPEPKIVRLGSIREAEIRDALDG